jgi:site-specific DNA recombinase
MPGNTGIDTQDLDTEAWAKRNGHTAVAVVADRKSGTIQPWDRPNLRPWVTDPEKIAQYDAVVGWRFDRLSRGDNQSTNAIEDWAYQNRKQLLTEDGLVFPCEGADGIRWDMAKRLAHEEWLKISMRYRRMQAHLRSLQRPDGGTGYLVGRPAWPYRRIEADGHKLIEPDPVKAPIIREAIERFLDGASLSDIVRWLGSVGAPAPTSGGKWYPKSVADIFTNESLIGKRRDKSGHVELRFEPVLANDDGSPDMAAWRDLQERMKTNAKRRGKIRDDPATLTGVVWCGKCGRIVHARRIPRKRVDGSVYDSEVGGAVMEQYADETYYETTITRGSDHQEELEDNAAEIASLDIDAPDYEDRRVELLAERKRLKALPDIPDEIKREAKGTVGERWMAADEAGRRKLLLDMGWRIILTSRESFIIEPSSGDHSVHGRAPSLAGAYAPS